MSEWIKKISAFNSEIFICPHCKGEAYYRHHKDGQCGYKFCPNCGKQIINEIAHHTRNIPTKNGKVILEISCFGYCNEDYKMTAEFQRVGGFLRVTLDGFSECNVENLVKFMSEAKKAYLAATETKGCD